MRLTLFLLLSCISTIGYSQSNGLIGKWKLRRIDADNRTLRPVPEVKEYFLTISQTSIAYNLDVNDCWGSIVSVSDSTIVLNNTGCAQVCCDGRVDAIALYINYSGRYTIVHDSLLIISNDKGKFYLKRE